MKSSGSPFINQNDTTVDVVNHERSDHGHHARLGPRHKCVGQHPNTNNDFTHGRALVQRYLHMKRRLITDALPGELTGNHPEFHTESVINEMSKSGRVHRVNSGLSIWFKTNWAIDRDSDALGGEKIISKRSFGFFTPAIFVSASRII